MSETKVRGVEVVCPDCGTVAIMAEPERSSFPCETCRCMMNYEDWWGFERGGTPTKMSKTRYWWDWTEDEERQRKFKEERAVNDARQRVPSIDDMASSLAELADALKYPGKSVYSTADVVKAVEQLCKDGRVAWPELYNLPEPKA